MLRALHISAILFLWLSTVPAQSGKPAGAVHRHATGLGLRLPPDWSAKDDTEAVVLLPPGIPADRSPSDMTELYVAVTQTGYNIADEKQFVDAMSAGFVQGSGKMVRSGERETFAAGERSASLYTWEMLDPSSQKHVAVRLYLAPAGSRAFVVVAIGLAELVGPRDSTLRQVVASMDFEAPPAAAGSSLATGTPLAQMWLAKLRGKVIKQFISSGSAAGEKTLLLASDGIYSFRSSVAIAADVPGVRASATGRNSNGGRWLIGERNGRAFLQLTDGSGDTRLLSLTMDNRNWYLNGEKAFAIDR